MRFGRRNKGRLFSARRAANGPQDETPEPDTGPVASAERSALISSGAEALDSMPDPEDEMLAEGDPTQRLLTALGRFQRSVAKGESGAAQEAWSDECMDHLIAAFEISREQKWKDVVNAVTDTARILQSYESAGCADACIPFLKDSYEILCLMVGDLIVDSVRSGVVDKWRERYDQAIEELANSGIPLVQDGEGEEAPSGETAFPEEAPPVEAATAAAPAQELEPGPFDLPEEGRAEEEPVFEQVPSLDEALGIDMEVEEPHPEPEEALSLDEALEADIEEPSAEADVPSLDGLVGIEEEPTGVEDISSPEEGVEVAAPSSEPAPAFEEEEPPDAFAGATQEREGEPAEEPAGVTRANAALDPEVAEKLDAFSEALGEIEKAPDADHAAEFDVMMEEVTALEGYAGERQLESAMRLCHKMRELRRLASESAGPIDDRFFDMAYGFCEAYVEACKDPQSSIVERWCQGCAVLIEDWTLAQAGTVVEEPAPEAPGEGDSPLVLLETARDAAARGDVSDAKTLTLRAAAFFARSEVAKSEQWIQKAERRFNENEEEMARARTAVNEAEQEVQAAESRVSEGEEQLDDVRVRIGSADQEIESINQRIAEIDEQICQLQEARAAEVDRGNEAQADLEETQEEEARWQSDLESRKEAEHAGRLGLEDARQNVKNVQHKRSQLEAALAQRRETLSRQRASLSDIEKTIAPLSEAGETPPADGADELLF